jgi:hypothetical protein
MQDHNPHTVCMKILLGQCLARLINFMCHSLHLSLSDLTATSNGVQYPLQLILLKHTGQPFLSSMTAALKHSYTPNKV